MLLGSVSAAEPLQLNDRGYFEKRGLNVMLGSDYYPDGHQGGAGIIQNGLRTATNGDLRLEPTPGQWQPMPQAGERTVDSAHQEIRVRMQYPDEKKNRTGFNPIDYPDLRLAYTVRVTPAGDDSFRIVVDLDASLPAAWVGKVGFNLELYPGILFGKSYSFGNQFGTFPRQADGPAEIIEGAAQLAPLGHGKRLTIAPESDQQRMTIEAVAGGELVLLDGRARHNNGWFVLRSLVAAGATKGAIEWLVTPHAIPDWQAEPVIQISQVGYHPKQAKVAIIELDPHDAAIHPAVLYRANPTGGLEKILEQPAKDWGRFLRSHYLQFDFSAVAQPGLYVVGYGAQRSAAFQISPEVFTRHVWQPTVEYFLPVQMCHMRVNDNYRVWHGFCHLDDALMAPAPHNHFDGYVQGPSTLSRFSPGDHVPGLDHGGWHDAGDYDLRVESQADTVHGLALAWELFHPTYDNTTIDQVQRLVEIHRPDGKPDILQQIEHGVLSIVGGYKSMGRLYRGIQDASLHQYTHLGDAAVMTDNQVFHDTNGAALKTLADAAVHGAQEEPKIAGLPPLGSPGSADDRWVFTEENPDRELLVAGGLAAAARALHGFNDPLADDCRRIAVELWTNAKAPHFALSRLEPAIELLQTTSDKKYADAVVALADEIVDKPERAAWLGARSLALIHDDAYRAKITAALRAYRTKVDALEKETPYGVPYKPDIWGAGWLIQRFGMEQYYLHAGAPEIFPTDYMLSALNFVLGCHPGQNNASFVSGVGAKSMTTAYGVNRADWSCIPGGVASGTALIRPDYPELLDWPFLWQQGEYCLGHPTSDYVFLVLAADQLLNH
ncbi:MAG TPA: glycoside hydrolase family 9 protein [Candidatus Didemnitutus sp.]|nr:glycoside hydrolase family 9 protein [Candidatus Didemnitutus sp.]